jgi:hypothetical protein
MILDSGRALAMTFRVQTIGRGHAGFHPGRGKFCLSEPRDLNVAGKGQRGIVGGREGQTDHRMRISKNRATSTVVVEKSVGVIRSKTYCVRVR